MKKITVVAFSLALIFVGCKKDSNDDAAPGTPTLTVNSTPQVSFKLDGVATSVIESSTIIQYVFSSKSLATPPDSSSGAWSAVFTNDATGDAIFTVDKGFLNFLGASPTTAAYSTFFKVGSSSYVANPDNQLGVRMSYVINGVEWSTNAGAGTQTGSTFAISETQNWSLNGETGVNILASFNCKLYDGSGNSKTITNGVAVCAFQND